jgi:hypothetical protein
LLEAGIPGSFLSHPSFHANTKETPHEFSGWQRYKPPLYPATDFLRRTAPQLGQASHCPKKLKPGCQLEQRFRRPWPYPETRTNPNISAKAFAPDHSKNAPSLGC